MPIISNQLIYGIIWKCSICLGVVFNLNYLNNNKLN